MSASAIYKMVIDDVIAKMKPETVQEGVDESVLDELRTLWQEKLTKKGLIRDEAMQPSTMLPRGPLPPGMPGQQGGPPGAGPLNTPAGMQQLMLRMLQMQHLQRQMQQQQQQQQGASGSSNPPPPAMPFSLPGVPSLPPQFAAMLAAQQQQQQQQQQAGGAKRSAPEGGFQAAGPPPSLQRLQQHQQPPSSRQGGSIPQQDGPADDDGVSGAAGGVHSQQAGSERGGEEEGGPSSPAGTQDTGGEGDAAQAPAPADDEALSSDSEPDSSDEEGDVEHFMCCQFEKVNRTKNRWKIAMREGVFHVHGRDYLFKKAQGEWTF